LIRLRPASLAAALSMAFAGSLLVAPGARAALPPTPAASAALATGLDKQGEDPHVRPQDDLFRAMNGRWLNDTPIPADRPATGGFFTLRDLSDERVKGIVERLAAAPQAAGSVNAKIADFYNGYMDTAAIDRAGLAPIQPYLAAIGALKDKHELVLLLGRWQGVVNGPLALQVGQDVKNPAVYSANTWQDGLGMPNRDYYLKDDARFAAAREAYRAYLAKLLTVEGDACAGKDAAAVFALETQLAQLQWSTVDNRDPARTYNPMTWVELAAKAPGVDWQGFAAASGLPAPDWISIAQPSYVTGLAKAIGDVPLDTWKAYLRVRVLDDFADVLPAAVREASFRFHDTAITGLTEDKPRWQKAVAALNAAMGEALGQVYVEQYFPPANKARMLALVDNLLATYKTSIDQLAWMSPATKVAAQDKLSKYTVKIGYPNRWRDYGKLEVKAGDPVGNAARASRFDFERQAVRVGKPVDRGEWVMTPQTVNAYYDPGMNEIVFPAAILQPPLFDMTADDATNYGAIGAIIGHEISHGFDDQGSQFDGNGRLRNWWTDADRKAFEAITARLVAQYSAYEPVAGQHLNGELTLGENIADLSGLQIAFKAYERTLGGKPAPVIGGLTGEQRFFLGWSQAWRSKTRDQRALQLLTIDPHSPAEFRANGEAMNSDAFHQAFGTHPGDRMWKAPEDRIRLW